MTTILTKVRGNKHPFQSEWDTSAGVLSVLAHNTCNHERSRGCSWLPQMSCASWQHFHLFSRNWQHPTARVPLLEATSELFSACISSRVCPKAYTGGSVETLLPTPKTAHTGMEAHPDTGFPDLPILRTGDSSERQNKTHSASRSTYYLDFSALYSRIPSAGPQICTRSSLVSFNKSAPGETHDCTKLILEHLYFL